jgi:hypothetical protein
VAEQTSGYIVEDTNKITTEKFINFQEKNGRKLHLILAIFMIILGFVILKITW